jgi:hypothetical protein
MEENDAHRACGTMQHTGVFKAPINSTRTLRSKTKCVLIKSNHAFCGNAHGVANAPLALGPRVVPAVAHTVRNMCASTCQVQINGSLAITGPCAL